jgi:hypothetical protein
MAWTSYHVAGQVGPVEQIVSREGGVVRVSVMRFGPSGLRRATRQPSAAALPLLAAEMIACLCLPLRLDDGAGPPPAAGRPLT